MRGNFSYDLGKWLQGVYKLKGLKEFMTADLPQELRIRGMTNKAHKRGTIKRVHRNEMGYTWRIDEKMRYKWCE